MWFAIYYLTLPFNNKMRTEGLGGSEPKRPLTFENLNKYGITIYDEYRDVTKKILDKNKKDESENKLYENFDYGLSDW